MKKTIVLTGGSKGMGRSTLLKFAENDFNIFTCSRKKTDLKSGSIKTQMNILKYHTTSCHHRCPSKMN